MAIRNVVILGSGCAGLTAAIYTARAGLEPLVIEGRESGGQLSLTTLVENFPGFPAGIQGPQLIENMREQAASFGATFVGGDVIEAKLGQAPFELVLEDTAEPFTTRSLIIASGARARWLDVPSEQALIGHGVSSCATCDGFFFRDKDIIVVGGGDSAMEEALFLTRFASSVTIVHRREEFRASKIMLSRAQDNDKIRFLTNTVAAEVLGEDSVRGLALRNTVTGEQSVLDVTGVFVAIGHDPRSDLVRGQVELDPDGYVLVRGHTTSTSIEGVFAAGDLVDRTYRQAVTAAGTGCSAAIDAERWLAETAHSDIADDLIGAPQ